MKLKRLTDDHVLLEAIENADMSGSLYKPTRDPNDKILAKVIAMGPGELNQKGERNPMPCSEGDTVLVGTGAGFHVTRGGKDLWFVYGGRKDIIAVVETAPALAVA